MTSKRKILDVTVTLSESLLIWPGDPPTKITQSLIEEEGETITVSHLSFGVHTGTHVDAPAHFIPGAPLVESLDLDLLIGDAVVVDMAEADAISADLLEKINLPPGTKRVLFRTKNSQRWAEDANSFAEDYVGITDDGAKWLVTRGVRVIGTDYLSVASMKENVSAHMTLLTAGVILIEALNLYDIPPGIYELICLPLKIGGVEGAPARVVLLDS